MCSLVFFISKTQFFNQQPKKYTNDAENVENILDKISKKLRGTSGGKFAGVLGFLIVGRDRREYIFPDILGRPGRTSRLPVLGHTR